MKYLKYINYETINAEEVVKEYKQYAQILKKICSRHSNINAQCNRRK